MVVSFPVGTTDLTMAANIHYSIIMHFVSNCMYIFTVMTVYLGVHCSIGVSHLFFVGLTSLQSLVEGVICCPCITNCTNMLIVLAPSSVVPLSGPVVVSINFI